MRLNDLFEDGTPEKGDIIEVEFGDLVVEGIFQDIDENGEMAVWFDDQGNDYITELVPLIPAAIAAGGAALSAYDAYQAKKAYDRGEISKSQLATQIGTNAAIAAVGGGAAKLATKGFKAAKAGINKLRGKDTTPDAPKKTPAKKRRSGFDYDAPSAFGKDNAMQRAVATATAVENIDSVSEAEYQGRKVKLGKPMRGDVKKFKVYVKNPKGNVVKVNFGHGGTSAKRKTMRIKKSNPARRKSFRARHNCDSPGPRHKARYWSCRAW